MPSIIDQYPQQKQQGGQQMIQKCCVQQLQCHTSATQSVAQRGLARGDRLFQMGGEDPQQFIAVGKGSNGLHYAPAGKIECLLGFMGMAENLSPDRHSRPSRTSLIKLLHIIGFHFAIQGASIKSQEAGGLRLVAVCLFQNPEYPLFLAFSGNTVNLIGCVFFNT